MNPPINFSINVPERIKSGFNWVAWKKVTRKNKITKVPISVKTGLPCNVTDSNNQVLFDEALTFWKSNTNACDGIGYCLNLSDRIVGLDLDNALDGYKAKPWAQEILDCLPNETYVEISPSGKGLRAFLGGIKTQKACKVAIEDGKFELYDTGRYLTVTGNAYRNGFEIPEAQDVIAQIQTRWFPKRYASEKVVEWEQPTFRKELPDEVLLSRMFASEKGKAIKRLWDGDISDYNEDDSSADQALLCYLAFWTGKNPEQMERLFFESSLGKRSKWYDRADYRKLSITRAIEHVSDVLNDYKNVVLNTSIGRLFTKAEVANIEAWVQSMDPDTSPSELILLLEPVLTELAKTTDVQAFSILENVVKKHFDLRAKDIEAYNKLVKEKRKSLTTENNESAITVEQALHELRTMPPVKCLHPALDFIDGNFYVGVMIKGQLFLVSSARELLSVYGVPA